MSNLSTSQQGILPRTGIGLLDWDPFRGLFNSSNWGFGTEITRTDTGYEIEIPAPGYAASQIEVTVEDGVLTAQGKNEKRSFRRSIMLPEEIDTDQIDAKVENGLLTVALKLHPKAQPKKIEVKALGK
jgi:HSP20 family protein